jgi:serine/threonine-protein kinase
MRRDADGKLVLIDFGAIKQVRNQQFTGLGEVTKTVAIGTPGYMPLEQAGGTPRPSSDLYALGIICIQALTGLYPTEIQENDATGELQWQHLVTVSPQLGAFLTKMTRYHFKDRYGTAREALQALQALDAGTNSPVLSAAAGSLPGQFPVPTAATWVAAPPAATSGSLQTPVYQRPTVAEPRLEPKPGGLVGRVLLGVVLLFGSAGLGYLWVRPQLSAAQFETLLQTDRCRIAAPRQNKFTKVRALPDRAATVKTEIKAGEKLLFIARKQQFVQVEQRNGQTGWVFNDQIDGCGGAIVPATPTPTTTPPIKKPVVVKPTPSSPLPTASSPGSSIAPSITSSPSPTNSSASPSINPSINPSSSPSSPLPTSSISPQPTPTQFTPTPSISGSTTLLESSSPTPSPSNS